MKILLIFLLLFLIKLAHSANRHEEQLDSEGNYLVAWEYDMELQTIVFEMTVQTTGYVGLGISSNGRMEGADIVIGGVLNNGTSYFTDRHGVGNIEPVIDDVQNWQLTHFDEDNGWTHLTVRRLLNTCDDDDVPIGEDLLFIIWSYGETDEIIYHNTNKGAKQFNLLDPPNPPFDDSLYIRHPIRVIAPNITQETLYWVTYHKIDLFADGSKFLIGFDPSPTRENPKTEKHSHHFVVSKCMTEDPEELDATFEPLLDKGFQSHDIIPVRQYCIRMFYAWAKGGKMQLFPEDKHFAMGDLTANEYLQFEIHFDNLDLDDITGLETGFDIFFTDIPREIDVGLMIVGLNVHPLHFIPGQTLDWTSVGHCTPLCTEKHFPEDGIRIFNVLLHAHLAGRKLKLRHFRGNVELPWISVDDNYDFDYQQNRNLKNDIVVFPGDQLTFECVYDTINRENVTMAGEGTMEEMCQVFFWYYPKLDVHFCGSQYGDPYGLFGEFGIEKFYDSFDPIEYWNPTIELPDYLQNLTLVNVLNAANWTEEFKDKIETMSRFDGHDAMCIGEEFDHFDKIKYPDDFNEYVPNNPCEIYDNPSTPESVSTSEKDFTSDIYSTTKIEITTEKYSTSESVSSSDIYSTTKSEITTENYSTSESVSSSDIYSTTKSEITTEKYSTSESVSSSDIYSTTKSEITTEKYSTPETTEGKGKASFKGGNMYSLFLIIFILLN